jgi:hypothetical protein
MGRAQARDNDLDGVSDATEVVIMPSCNATDNVGEVDFPTSADHRATVILSTVIRESGTNGQKRIRP